MPEGLTINTAQNVKLQFQIAPLGDRIVASLIDLLIRGALMFVIVAIGGLFAPDSPGQFWKILFIISILVPFVLYHFLFEVFNNGQSPGKRAFDLRVVSLTGENVSVGAYLLRWLFRIVDFQIFTGLVALIAVAASKKGQRIGDMVAGTTVIKETTAVRFRQLAYDESPDIYQPVYPQARSLKPAHIELIKETLNNPGLENSDQLVVLLAQKTASMLGVQYDEHPRKFLRTVLNDYYRTSRA